MDSDVHLDRSSLNTGRVLVTIARMLRDLTFDDPSLEGEVGDISKRLESIADNFGANALPAE